MKSKLDVFNEKLNHFLSLKECRRGQAIINALSFADKEYCKSITGTGLDCFYSDEYVDSCLETFVAHLSKEVATDIKYHNPINVNVTIDSKTKENTDIKFNILSEEEMRKLGFTDYSKKSWYSNSLLGKGITFNISIDKETSKGRIDVLADDWGQPYQYQQMIISGTTNSVAFEIHNKVQECMKRLVDNGIIENYKENDYI